MTSPPAPKNEKRTALKAIRFHCLKCCGWEKDNPESMKPMKAVRECADQECDLYPFRMGKNPYHPRTRAKRLLESSPFVKKHRIEPHFSERD